MLRRLLYFLIYITNCAGDGNLTFYTDYELIYTYRNPWEKFWMNITELSRFTKYASIIEYNKYEDINTTRAKLSTDANFNDVLMHYLFESELLPLVSMTSAPTNKTNITRFQTLKQMKFVTFENLEDFRSSMKDSKITIYENRSRSFYLFFILSENLDMDCDGGDFIQLFKEKMGEYFQSLLDQFGIVEVTVVFPRLCLQVFILKYDFIETHKRENLGIGVRILNREDFENKPDVLLHNYGDFKKYPIVINVFERSPTYVKKMPLSFDGAYRESEGEVGNVGGLDGFALSNMVKIMNFNATIKPPSDNNEYGYLQKNGTFTGSINDIINKRMDISFNARFLRVYGTEGIEFTYPVFHDEFCVIVPKSQPIPSWMSIFLVFSIPVWISVGVTCLIFGIIWWYMKTKLPGSVPNQTPTMQCFYFLDMLLVMTSAPLIPLPTIHVERVFITVCLIFNLIFASLFQGFLSTAYSTNTFFPEINSLVDLDKSGHSISTKNSDIFGSVSGVGDSLTRKIKANHKLSMDEAAFKRTTTVIERRTDARFMINLNFTGRDGTPLLHIVNECPRSYHLAYIVYKGYPLLPHINRFFQRVVEVGLNEKWYFDTEYSLLLKNRQKEEAGESTRKLQLEDVQTSFFVLIYGLLFSTIVFVVELIVYWLQRAKNREIFIKSSSDESQFSREVDTPRFPFFM